MFGFYGRCCLGPRKRWWLLSVLLLLVFVFSGCSEHVGQTGQEVEIEKTTEKSGLLLGVKIKAAEEYSSWKKRARYQTLFLANKEGEITLIRQDEGILVPKEDGFWSVNVATEKISDTYETVSYEGNFDHLVIKNTAGEIVSADKKVEFTVGELAREYYEPGHSSTVNIDDNELIELTFVGKNHLSYLVFSHGYLGGAHGYDGTLLGTKELGRDNFLEISAVLGEEAQRELYQEGKTYYARHQNEGLDREVRNGKHWGLLRQNGKWTITGILGFSSQAARGTYALFDSFQEPGPKIVSHNLLSLDWFILRGFLPEVKDAFSSPPAGMLVVLTADELQVYPQYRGDNLGDVYTAYNWRDILGLQADEEVEVVMSEWAAEPDVGQWAAALQNYAENSFVLLGAGTQKKVVLSPGRVLANPFDASQVNVGDTVCGLTVKKMKVDKRDHKAFQLEFSGQVEVSGTYEHEGAMGPMTPCIAFYPDREFLPFLPSVQDDMREVWFRLNDYKRIKDDFGEAGSSGKATIVLDNYFIDLNEAATSNTADLLRIKDLQPF